MTTLNMQWEFGGVVPLKDVTLSSGITFAPPENCVAIKIGVQSVRLSDAGNWGFRLEGKTSGYRAGHSRIEDSVTSVSTSGSWFVVGGHADSVDEYYGEINLSLVDPTNNRWVCSSTIFEYIGAGCQRMSSGTVTLNTPLTEVLVYGSGADHFDFGSLSIVYYVAEPV